MLVLFAYTPSKSVRAGHTFASFGASHKSGSVTFLPVSGPEVQTNNSTGPAGPCGPGIPCGPCNPLIPSVPSVPGGPCGPGSPGGP